MRRSKRGVLTPTQSSIVLDLKPILAARNILQPSSFLIKLGLNNTSVTKMLKGEAVQVNFNQLTKLCVHLNCTPNDLFVLRDLNLPDNHQLHQLRQATDEIINPLDILKGMSLEEIKQLRASQLG